MKRSYGAPPAALCVVTAVLLALHLALIIHVKRQIPRLEARVKAAEFSLVLTRGFEADDIPVRYRPSGRLSEDAGLLAGLRDLDRSLPQLLWLTTLFFLGSLTWRKPPHSE